MALKWIAVDGYPDGDFVSREGATGPELRRLNRALERIGLRAELDIWEEDAFESDADDAPKRGTTLHATAWLYDTFFDASPLLTLDSRRFRSRSGARGAAMATLRRLLKRYADDVRKATSGKLIQKWNG